VLEGGGGSERGRGRIRNSLGLQTSGKFGGTSASYKSNEAPETLRDDESEVYFTRLLNERERS
jgi:hypothetical protein